METGHPPKKKPKSKFGRRKRRSSARTKKIETVSDSETVSLLKKQKENHLNLIVEVGSGGDFSTCTNNTQPQPEPQSTLFSPSMPETAVTSRSKRLRGATTATIAYTDRKTRSTSTSHSNSSTTNIFVEGQEQEEQLSLTDTFSSFGKQTPSFQSNHSNGESEEKDGTRDQDNNVNHNCESEQRNHVNYKIEVDSNDEGRRDSNTLDTVKSMKSEIKKDEEETDKDGKISVQASIPVRDKSPRDLSLSHQHSVAEEETASLKGENLTNSQPERKLDIHIDGNLSTTIVVQNATVQDNAISLTSDLSLQKDSGSGHENKSLVAGQRQRHRGRHDSKYVTPDPLSSLSSSGGGGGFSKKCKVPLVEDRKLTTLAPMLLMNNLPYMGELTFDTRPRRGRKPKKADICHLISKNYGIHFPNSYTNTPYTGPPSSSVPPPSLFSKVSSLQQTGSLGKSGRSKTKKSNKDRISSSIISSCPTIVPLQPQPPALLPISTSNRFKSSFSRVSGNKDDQDGSEFQNSCTSQKRDFSGNRFGDGETVRGEEPLNLCVRDDANKMFSLQCPSNTQLNLNSNCSGMMNLKPMLSPNLFSELQLKSQINDRVRPLKKNRQFEEGCKKFKSNLLGNNFLNSSSSSSSIQCGSGSLPKFSGENATTVRDLGLVNQLNFQLNLAKCAHLSSETSSLVQSRDAFSGFAPLTNSTGSGSLVSKGEGKKSRRKGSHLKIKKEGLPGESSYHVPTTTGGSLFGQKDSGSNSGAQVSICKFKFTGGAKPSLQEKKMLSVDSGGNFRFYTDKDKIGSYSSSLKSSKAQGTSHSPSGGVGDGESHQGEKDHQQGVQGVHYAYSALTLPKSAKSMSVCMPVRPFSLQLPTPNLVTESATSGNSIATKLTDAQPGSSSNIQQGAITPTVQELNNLHLDGHGRFAYPFQGEDVDGYSSSQSSESGGPSHSHVNNRTSLGFSGSGPSASTSSGHFDAEAFKTRKLLRLKRKRRTRKSLMREKLEKTFKEKGFLIQTQQLESAEGATYCKFRQLRKFTRYLFRSWKDYLPDNVKEINNSGAGGSGGVLLSPNSEGLQTDWKIPGATPSGTGADYNCDEEVDEDDTDDEDETRIGLMELVPEVTLITQPSTPATIVDVDDVDEEPITYSEEGEVGDESDQDGDNDDDVDVEEIDDRKGGDFSDNHNSP